MAKPRRLSVYLPQGALGDALAGHLEEGLATGYQASGLLLRWALLGQQAERSGWSIAIHQDQVEVIAPAGEPVVSQPGRAAIARHGETESRLPPVLAPLPVDAPPPCPALPVSPSPNTALDAADTAMASLFEQFDC